MLHFLHFVLLFSPILLLHRIPLYLFPQYRILLPILPSVSPSVLFIIFLLSNAIFSLFNFSDIQMFIFPILLIFSSVFDCHIFPHYTCYNIFVSLFLSVCLPVYSNTPPPSLSSSPFLSVHPASDTLITIHYDWMQNLTAGGCEGDIPELI